MINYNTSFYLLGHHNDFNLSIWPTTQSFFQSYPTIFIKVTTSISLFLHERIW